MGNEKNLNTARDQEQQPQENTSNKEHPLNPFKDQINTSENKEKAQEEIEQEQQFKEALTERD
jgi:hypothetical protein